MLKLDAEATGALIADFPDVSVAGYVSPRQTVIAGPVAPVDAVVAVVSGQNRFARRVNMEVASHTALMDPILPDLRAALADLGPNAGHSVYLHRHGGHPGAGIDAEYWAANVREPARLSQAITAAAEDHGTFIEISAHPILTHAVSDTLESMTHHHSVGTLWRDGDDTVTFHTNLNTTHTNHPPETPHPPEPHSGAAHHSVAPHPALVRCHTVRRRSNRLSRRLIRSNAPRRAIPREWYCKLAWPAATVVRRPGSR